MSSDLYSTLVDIQQNDYGTLALLTVVAYDYVPVFPKEIEYIWNKSWTWVSMLFILVRYFGLCNLAMISLYGSIVLHGTAMTYVFIHLYGRPSPGTCKILIVIELWTYILFLGPADFVMILRIWAMYNRSRLILGSLLGLFAVEITAVIVAGAVYSQPANAQAIVIQVPGYSFCALQFKAPIAAEVGSILQMIFGATLCTLAIVQSARESLQMYRATRHWQLSRYIKLLVSQGIVYFFALFLLNLVSLLSNLGKIPGPGTGWASILVATVAYVPVYTLSPRFIISIREVYTHDVRGRGGGVDTGFGLSTFSSRGATRTPIAFADGTQSEVVENIEEIPRGFE